LLVIGIFSLMVVSQIHRTTDTILIWSRSTEGSPELYYSSLGTTRGHQTYQDAYNRSQPVVAGDDFLDGIVPPSWYIPQSSRPLALRFLGRASPSFLNSTHSRSQSVLPIDADVSFGPVWDAVERSKYGRVAQAVLYDPVSRRVFRTSTEDIRATTSSSTTKSADMAEEDRVVVTLVDWAALERDCHVLCRMLRQPSLDASGHGQPQPTASQRNIFLYWDATNSPVPRACEEGDGSLFSKFDSFFYVQRSAVQGRHWNESAHWIMPGERIQLSAALTVHPQPHIQRWYHEGHPLREEFVAQLTKTSRSDLESLPSLSNRTTAASFFLIKGNLLPYSHFREHVSSTVGMLAMEKGLPYLVDEILLDEEEADAVEKGRSFNAVQLERVASGYVKALLASKIVVVASHDEWEGHWRLWESMASGALVLSEPMVAPPAGLENGTNIIVYDSAESLRQLILYYLKHDKERRKIAQRGQKLALGLHRSWHGLERVLFGKPLTRASEPFSKAPRRRHDWILN
jgi:hypothetical protein